MDVLPSQDIQKAWARLVRAAEFARASVERDLKDAGFPPLAWYDVLLELDREPEGGLRPLEIERRILMAQYNMSRLIDRLVREGLVSREPCAEDGRGSVIRITRKGRDLRGAMWPVYAAAIQRHVGDKLGEAQAEGLADLLVCLMPADQKKPIPLR
ncbi:winged helix-turn-helix transcriptional regulator [Stappia sp. F7233]|uniref:Winged helix-turn-helix transcriptional regulator n=2 Tax=Stappia albiluteola TaxID=2758565 RepID=A0A839AH91_9HYPH|nr:winged helix-turn-helix transcriptional regulator [Stappia albiluteola]